ncbi:SAM-dependent methyltransferase [Mycolicibacter minnesotensis]|uniref:SAM-dependent methyltransferase n=1 Tax=Mycolicibacter minnesotensis TaxID=1118379 RepID=A0A7I7R9Y8_9MYCO|nr:class I SAM-dependent methyltransferase [Mycolicibacter minnesotensis]ORB03069.1 SAM-dependent methyltransferase [Mycolicibacter minnesotensis]BBY35468.1 SAM-dependent methyltransferase [Mycolicibacter minnesotensis]
MSAEDRNRWDARYAQHATQEPAAIGPAAVFAPYTDEFPVTGHALDIACGRGAGALWLAQRGLQVLGCDVSPVAIEQARHRARDSGLGDRCHFEVSDLDDGLPDGPAADVVYCARFRDQRLDAPMAARLAPGGLLAVTALSQVTGGSGRFRAAPGELRTAFAGLAVIAEGDTDGLAWLLARRGR